jgi:hypothetical protein
MLSSFWNRNIVWLPKFHHFHIRSEMIGAVHKARDIVVSKSVANPWRDPKIAVLVGKKRSKVGFAHGVDSRHFDRSV